MHQAITDKQKNQHIQNQQITKMNKSSKTKTEESSSSCSHLDEINHRNTHTDEKAVNRNRKKNVDIFEGFIMPNPRQANHNNNNAGS